MSDTESNAPPAHATLGGKSLAAFERPRYKSWRKKFRKMKVKFDETLEENKRLFKDEHQLESIARRLKEELDGLLELCLDLNQQPALPPALRFDISLPVEHTAVAAIPSVVPADITPEAANALFTEYTTAVKSGQIPHLDLHVIRAQIDRRLAAQEVEALDALAARVAHAQPPADARALPDDLRGDEPPGFLTADHEDACLARQDAGDPVTGRGDASSGKQKDGSAAAAATGATATTTTAAATSGVAEDRHWSEYTPREIERQIELQNPQSQHNWLKSHAKQGNATVIDMDDAESLVSHEAKPPTSKGAKRNLARQVGDRALERAREGMSPSSHSAGFADEDELTFVDEQPSSTKKRGRGDPDGTYRVKGGKGAGGSGRGKRKRAGADDHASSKKAKTETAAT